MDTDQSTTRADNPTAPHEARQLSVTGRVQGVGFRPFVYRLARAHGLRGWVRNDRGAVTVRIEGPAEHLEAFQQALTGQAPPLAEPRIAHTETVATQSWEGFEIQASDPDAEPDIHVPPDFFACDPCLTEMADPNDRRYRYPFVNCTQCGPRYTLITAMPYDRPNTTMAGFPLCAACRGEYEDPGDRRFHAEPVACPACGPQLTFQDAQGGMHPGNECALTACLDALRAGDVVAVRGIGGYHLLCDARSESAVNRLRQRKTRPHKPLAVMVPWDGHDGLAAARRVGELSDPEAQALATSTRPIVLVRRRGGAGLAPALAPGLGELGLMLPYSPLHHLLMDGFGGPLVATSGNISGEPVLTDPDGAAQRLSAIADAFLHHNRPIQRPADDPVCREIAGQIRPLRLGRGNAPWETMLPASLPGPVLAVGGFMKNTVALGWDRRAVISPHIGDLDSPRGLGVFEQVAEELQRLYGVTAERIVCDAHPDYTNTRWARRRGSTVVPVYHHHAHASALAGEYQRYDPMLVFTWDGTGLGPDDSLWGGEALLGTPGDWRRVASMRPFHLPGGDRAGREPWRAALALCWAAGVPWQGNDHEEPLLRQAWERGLNSPRSTAVGRLFDAAAALTGLVPEASFEGHGPMWLEAASTDEGEPLALPLAPDDGHIWRSDWAPLVGMLQASARPLGERAACFHSSLAHALRDQARVIRDEHGITTVGLTGGVFQNRRLTEQARALLTQDGFEVLIPATLPCNDAGISFGQLVEAAAGS